MVERKEMSKYHINLIKSEKVLGHLKRKLAYYHVTKPQKKQAKNN